MVRYLLEGGFAAARSGQLSLLQRAIQEKVGDRLQRVKVGLEHPLFHSYYDIEEYVPSWIKCPPTGPLPGLELDGRLIAIVPPPFVLRFPCPSNELYVNVLAYALIQPSRMGGRYMVRK